MHARAVAQETDPALALVRALAQLHDLVALVDTGSGELRWLSPSLAELCGARVLPGAHWLDALSGTRPPNLDARLRATGMLSGEPIELKGVAGRRVSARVSAARLEHRGCAVTTVIFRLEDDRRVADEFRSRIDALSAVLAGAPDGVVVLDRSRFIT